LSSAEGSFQGGMGRIFRDGTLASSV